MIYAEFGVEHHLSACEGCFLLGNKRKGYALFEDLLMCGWLTRIDFSMTVHSRNHGNVSISKALHGNTVRKDMYVAIRCARQGLALIHGLSYIMTVQV